MGLNKEASLVSVLRVVLASYPLVLSAQAGEATIEGQYDEALIQARHRYPNLSFPEDNTPNYLVRATEVTGNTLLSVQDLLGDIPALYVVKSRDRNVPPEAYDFRTLKHIIRAPGELRQVSTRTIKGFTEYLLSRYTDRGYAGIYVYVSAKAIRTVDASTIGVRRLENDILSIHVIEGRVGSIAMKHFDADGNKKDTGILKDSVIAAWSPVKPGGQIEKQPLDEFVRLLNDNPDRYVRHTVSTGDEPNSLDLTYVVYEGNPWHPYIQVDNSGTDERRWSPRIGLFNTNLSGHDDRASIMYQADLDDPGENYAAFGSYGIPLITPKFRVSGFGGYSAFDITPEATGGLLTFLGAGSFYGGNLRYNLVQMDGWFFDLTGSLSSENSKVHSNLGIGSDVDMHLMGLGFEVHRADAMSDTSVAFDRIENIGGSDASDFTEARTDAKRDFIKYSLVASHSQYLDKAKLTHIGGSFRSISSNGRLVPAKMTTFGGLYSVRGYPEDVLVVDGGILASLEYRRCLIRNSDGEETTKSGEDDKIRPTSISLLTFTDYGIAKIKDPLPSELGSQDMWSVGLGTLITIGGNFEARIYHGWVLREIRRASDDHILANEGDGAWNFSFLYRW
jgi:hemolysin activation/secretion protein